MLPSFKQGPSLAGRQPAPLVMTIVVVLVLGIFVTISPKTQSAELPANVQARLPLHTPVSDELLYELEKNFVELLQQSKNAEALLKAEELLIATNDNTHWTNYAQASTILRATHDPAAIPLLLRYIVLHSRRSSCHIMIPEYARSISLISGKDLPELYEAGPNLEDRMRGKVQALVNDWWRPAKTTLTTDPEKMNADQLRVVAARLLKQVRYDGDFTGSGGKRDSAYGAYHNVYYRLRSHDVAERHAIAPLHPSMVTMLLAPSGYRTDRKAKDVQLELGFPYEAVVILSEIAKIGGHDAVRDVAHDENQNTTVSMICLLALYRAGYPYDTERMLRLLASETDLERRLILLLSLRWGDERATAALLKNMDDANAEIATAAACALVDVQPPEAIPKLKKLLERNYDEAPLMLLNAAAAFRARDILENLLVEAVEGKRNSRHLSRILDAFADAWEVPRDVYRRQDDRDYERQARLALDYCREQSQREQAERRRMSAAVESLQTQLQIALEIETLRRDEYKRLLKLQGEEIVTAEESKRAHEQLKMASGEVESIRTILRERESLLNALNKNARWIHEENLDLTPDE